MDGQLVKPDHHPIPGPSSSRKNCLWRRTRKLQLFVGWLEKSIIFWQCTANTELRPDPDQAPLVDGVLPWFRKRHHSEFVADDPWFAKCQWWCWMGKKLGSKIKVPFPFRSFARQTHLPARLRVRTETASCIVCGPSIGNTDHDDVEEGPR